MNGEAIADAARLRHQMGAGAGVGYALAYGSHAHDTAGTASDLDLLFVGDQTLTAPALHALVTAVKSLHHRHGLAADEEVCYKSKLYATGPDVSAATALGGFDASEQGQLTATPVVVEPWWLNSRPFRLRLILNALTTPHVFLGGDLPAYRRHTQDAETAVALLALALVGRSRFGLADAVAVLLDGPDGATGEDWLGYRPGPHLASLLHRGMAALAEHGIVRFPDGTHLEQDPELRRRAVVQLRRRANAAGAKSGF